MSGSASCTFALNTKDHVRNACMEFAIENGLILNKECMCFILIKYLKKHQNLIIFYY